MTLIFIGTVPENLLQAISVSGNALLRERERERERERKRERERVVISQIIRVNICIHTRI